MATEPVGRRRLGLADCTAVCRTEEVLGLEGVLLECGATYAPSEKMSKRNKKKLRERARVIAV